MVDKVWYDRRILDIDKIDRMIQAENDPEKRSVLQVLQFLTTTLSSSIRVLEELDAKVSETLEEHDKKIEEHTDLVKSGRTAWKIASGLFTVIQVLVLAAAGYVFHYFDEIRNTVKQNTALVESISKRVDAYDYRAETLGEELNVIKKKRVIRASK